MVFVALPCEYLLSKSVGSRGWFAGYVGALGVTVAGATAAAGAATAAGGATATGATAAGAAAAGVSGPRPLCEPFRR